MSCPHCGFVATPGQEAVEGVCPSCERPYRDQPTPLNSEMEMRDMPAPEEEDTGGNPLQEGILGDFQNRGVRDEAFAHVEPDFVIDDVLVPDPESIRPDKEQMDGFLDNVHSSLLGDIADVAAPVAGGVGGFMLGGPAGAAIGAGLAGGGMSAAEGGGVGDIATQGLTDAALGGLGGVGAGALGVGSLGAEEAASQGATKGALGSLMKSAWGKLPNSRLQQLYYGDKLLNGASGQMEQATQPAPGMLPPQGQGFSPSIYSAVETPTSHGEIPSNDTDDPEEVDFHENEQDKPGLNDPSINDIGGTDLGPDDFFSPDSGALASFAELLPKVLQYALGDQSAAGDPDMEDLHAKLEAEKPGYMNSANDDDGHKLMVFIMGGGQGGEGEESGDDLLSDNDKPHDPISEHEATALRPGLENTCPTCGSVLDPSSQHCPQCGAPNMRGNPQNMTDPVAQAEGMPQPSPIVAHTAGMQGPQTKEQQAAVAELLQQEGRGEEVPQMIMEPQNYADEMAQIAQQEAPPENIGQEGPPPPVPPSQPGEMPMGGMTPPGPPSPMSGPSMMAAVKKYALSVDGFCEACPKCGSHSTGYADYEEGDAGCKSCGHTWKAKEMAKNSAAEDMAAAPVEPELSQAQPEVEQEQSGSLSWTDESGSPLQVGQSYDMYSNNYDIPDRITVTAVKPDVIEYTINGEYGLSHQSELTHEEASVEGDTFIPVAAGEEAEHVFEEPQGAQPMDAAPGQETDLSTPHEMMASKHADFDDTNPPGMEGAGPAPTPGFENDVTEKDAGQASKVMEFLMSQGFPEPMAREQAIRLVRELGKFELGNVAEDIQAAPEVEHPMGPTAKTVKRMQADTQRAIANMGSAPPLREEQSDPSRTSAGYNSEVAEFFGDDYQEPELTNFTGEPESSVGTGPDWLMGGDDHRTAGAHMSPWEQRGYIEESGDARNADKLNLGGTHYEFEDLAEDSFLFGQ